jgi:hypothetical protein
VGVSITRQLNVTVLPLPSISSFTVGESPITEGDSTTLIPVFADGSGSIDNGIGAVTSGSTVTISPATSTTYVLTVTNSLGASVSRSSIISVVLPPSISSFDAASPTISLGSNTSLTAVFVDGTGSIDNEIGTVTSAAPVMVAPSVTTSYVLTVSNSAGAEVSQQTEIVVTGSFKRTSGDLTNGRAIHTATALDDGDVLLVGGYSPLTETAELYDSASGSFTSVGSLAIRRFFHTATKLQDGRVLVVGGTASPPELADAALYDPSTRTFTPTGSLSTARFDHTATLLPDGRVLITGGQRPSEYLTSAEVYDPVLGTFSTTDSLADGRRAHAATLLPDGSVLITGGYNSTEYLTSAEVYDPATDTFSSTGSMATARHSHTSTMLLDGRLLIAGGFNRVDSNTFLDSTELYDVETGVFSASGRMSSLRAFHTATRLESGKVLVTGGNRAQNTSTVLSSAELYDPLTDSFDPTGDMNVRRYNHSATLLFDGKVLIAGGNDGNTEGLTSAELYEPVAPVAIDWEAIGGPASFGIQAISFDPIQVDGFLGMETSGSWRNETGTTNSSLSLQIYLNIGGQFAQNDSIRGPFGSVFGLDGFVFFDVDFSAGSLSGINFTNSVAGSGSYSGMTPGTTLTFRRP